MTSDKVKLKENIRKQAEDDLQKFIELVHPNRVLGSVHKELLSWWTRETAKSHQLVLLPRDHQKSAMVAYRVAWEITRNPAVRILYISATSLLAIKQLKFIKDILTSDNYRYYWPDMVNKEESKRELWTQKEIAVDHPLRKAEAIRDPTIFTAGLTTSITGMHCDVAVMDDVVIIDNAYTEDGREKVSTQYSLLASIEGADSREWLVGTRYHPKDLYGTLMSTELPEFDEDGNEIGSEPLYELFERQVETRGDGTGEYLWPRQQRYDGKWFGFDLPVLAKKKAQYLDRTQFRAQYYNDPNDIESASITPDLFQYYDRKFLERYQGKWYFKGNRLNVFASIDFAFSLAKEADFTSIAVVGMDKNNNVFILDIDRFKTDKISHYFEHILKLHQKWDFRKIRVETVVAQKAIAKSLKEDFIKPYGLALSVVENNVTRNEGRKEERIDAVLQHRYDNGQMFHYHGGNCQVLEDELVLQKPPHDDVKDSVAAAVEFAVPPTGGDRGASRREQVMQNTHSRFGGIF